MNNKLKFLPDAFFNMTSLGDIHLENNKLNNQVKNKLEQILKEYLYIYEHDV
jgi:hypothetical protein